MDMNTILNKNMSLALLINVYFLAICLAFCHLRYGAIDDYFMAGILSGMYGDEFNVHMPFVNAMYGYLLLPLYHLFPRISWYYIGEIAAIFISLTAITYVLINKIGRGWGGILGVLLIAAYAKDMYIVLQFTQCAEVLSAAGMVVLICGFERANNKDLNKSTLAVLAIGILLLWWGSFMRWEAFLMGMPFFCVVLLLCVHKFGRVRRCVVLTLLLTFVGAWGFHEFNQSLYQSPEYKTFVEFQPFRALLGDGEFYNEQAVYEDVQELGLNSNDFSLLKKWVFYDNEVFAPESVQTIVRLINKHTIRPHLNLFPMMLLQSFSDMVISPIFGIWLLFCIVLFVSNSRRFYVIWISLLLIVLAIACLLCINRLVYRVEVGLWLYVTVLTIVFYKVLPKIPQKVYCISILFLLGITGYVYYENRGEFRSPNNAGIVQTDKVFGAKGYKSLFAFMDSQPDSVVFMVPMATYMDLAEHRLPPYLNEPIGSWQRIIPTGFWTPYYPDVEKSFRSRGIVNPVKDLVKENVYYVYGAAKDNYSLVDFLEAHHYNCVKIDTVKKFEDVSVLKYSVVRDSNGVEK